MVSRLKKKLTYYSVDLPEGCLIQYYFLKKCGLKPKIIDNISEIKKNTINIIPYENSLKLLRKIKNVDIVFNSRSFSEMSSDVLNRYFKIINQTLKPLYIYHENSNYLLFPKSERHIEILGKNFGFNKSLYFLKILIYHLFQVDLADIENFCIKENKMKKNYKNLWRKSLKIIPGGNGLLSKRPERFLLTVGLPTTINLKMHLCGIYKIKNI